MNNNVKRNLWIDYLRSALTVLVVAHHSTLAYTTFASFNKNAYILSTHPVVDVQRLPELDIFVNFNDIFFMSLMYMIGGLFIIKSLNKKGVSLFIKDRWRRLFLPFIIGGTLLMLLAYFPAFYIAHHNTNFAFYIKDFFTTESWPVGPPWFIWVLFIFNIIFTASYSFWKKFVGPGFLRVSQQAPLKIIFLLFAVSWILYVPLAIFIGPERWTGIGPFDFQISRLPLYFGYFMIGILIGYTDFNNMVFAASGRLVSRWRLWAVMSLLIFTLLRILPPALTKAISEKSISGSNSLVIYYSVYAASCTLTCIAFLTAFRNMVGKSFKIWDSLTENAYVIYLVHYVFVTWTQFLLLGINLPAIVKFGLTFAIALTLSWLTAILLRRIKIIDQYL